MNFLTDKEIRLMDNIELDEFDYVKDASVINFARAIEQAIFAKLKEQGYVVIPKETTEEQK